MIIVTSHKNRRPRITALIRSSATSASISPASHLHHFILPSSVVGQQMKAELDDDIIWPYYSLPPGCCCCRTVPDLLDPVGAVGGGAFSCHTQESRDCCVQRFFVLTIVAGAQRSRQFTRSCSTERDDAANAPTDDDKLRRADFLICLTCPNSDKLFSQKGEQKGEEEERRTDKSLVRACMFDHHQDVIIHQQTTRFHVSPFCL
jgi:hypothetical protein